MSDTSEDDKEPAKPSSPIRELFEGGVVMPVIMEPDDGDTD